MERAAEGKRMAHVQPFLASELKKNRQYKNAEIKLYNNSFRITLLPYMEGFPRNPSDAAPGLCFGPGGLVLANTWKKTRGQTEVTLPLSQTQRQNPGI